FSFHDPAPTAIYTLSLHDALPIFGGGQLDARQARRKSVSAKYASAHGAGPFRMRGSGLRRCSKRGDGQSEVDPERFRTRTKRHRSEEHTSELQSLAYLVCRLLLEK